MCLNNIVIWFVYMITAAPSNGVCADESSDKGMDHLAKSPRLHVQENGRSGRCSLERICAHQVLQECEPNSPNNASNNKLKKKVLLWSSYCLLIFGFWLYAKVNRHK